MTSADDPVFFLHHCFIDKVWADWQAEQRQSNEGCWMLDDLYAERALEPTRRHLP